MLMLLLLMLLLADGGEVGGGEDFGDVEFFNERLFQLRRRGAGDATDDADLTSDEFTTSEEPTSCTLRETAQGHMLLLCISLAC